MKKTIKYIAWVFCVIWVITSTFFTYIFFRNSWEDFKHDNWESLVISPDLKIPVIDQNLNIEIESQKILFHKRIQPIKGNNLYHEIQEKYKSEFVGLGIPQNSFEDIQQEFENIYQKWPKTLRLFADKHIYRILIVQGIHTTARIFQINNTDQFVIVVNEKVLTKDANTWMTETEELVFNYSIIEESEYSLAKEKLEVVIENENDNILTLENILVHEIGHAFGVIKGITTNFNQKIDSCFKFNFFEKNYTNRVVFETKNKYADDYKAMTYYADPFEKLSFLNYADLINNLEKTPFPTMYASNNHLEFFAETFYSYVHCELQKKPFKYILTDSNGNVTEVFNGITEERCAYERNIIASYFDNSDYESNKR